MKYRSLTYIYFLGQPLCDTYPLYQVWYKILGKNHLRIESWIWSFNEGMNGITDAHIVTGVARQTKMCASVIPFIPSLNNQNQLCTLIFNFLI